MDKRIVKTKLDLYHAMQRLLERMDYREINVQRLLEEAHISRSTFYAHFKSKDEVLLSVVSDLFDHVFSHSLQVEETHDFSKNSILDFSHLITHILYHLHDEKAMISAIINASSSALFFEKMRERVHRINEVIVQGVTLKDKAVPFALQLEIADENFIVLVKHWFRDGCLETPETIASYYFSLLS